MKYWYLAVLVLAAIGTWVYVATRKKNPPPPVKVSEPTNFVEIGLLHFPAPESGQSQGTLEYNDGPGLVTKKLGMDGLSVCGTADGALACLAMSVTFDHAFDGKTAFVEGTLEGNTILVRKLYAMREGELLLDMDPGSRFIAWATAVHLLQACQVTQAMQTHALDVYLDLKDGRRVRAVEPQIDAVFTVIDQTKAQCGDFPVATE